VLCFKEIVRVVEVNRLLPSLSGLLMTLEIRIMGDKDPSFVISLGSFMLQRRRELSSSP
jgi:hypothetical protein